MPMVIWYSDIIVLINCFFIHIDIIGFSNSVKGANA